MSHVFILDDPPLVKNNIVRPDNLVVVTNDIQELFLEIFLFFHGRMDLKEVPKKVQYMIIDSIFVNGSNNTFSVNFNFESNVFIEEMKDVIGFKIVDFFVTQIGDNSDGTGAAAKFIDVECKEIPTPAQLLNERNGQILERIPIERNFSGSSGIVLHDKQGKLPGRNDNYFNPISIKNLNFKIYEQRGNNTYTLLQPDAEFSMIVQITTIDHDVPKVEKPDGVLEKLDTLIKLQQQQPPPPPPREEKQKLPFGYLVLLVFILLGGYLYFKKPQPVQPTL